MAGAVYHVIEGRGTSRLGDTELGWERGDTFCRAAWQWVSHANVDATAPACLFQFNDEPAVRALGLWRARTRETDAGRRQRTATRLRPRRLAS
jgi:gentisate 1,2-dioxygenase